MRQLSVFALIITLSLLGCEYEFTTINEYESVIIEETGTDGKHVVNVPEVECWNDGKTIVRCYLVFEDGGTQTIPEEGPCFISERTCTIVWGLGIIVLNNMEIGDHYLIRISKYCR